MTGVPKLTIREHHGFAIIQETRANYKRKEPWATVNAASPAGSRVRHCEECNDETISTVRMEDCFVCSGIQSGGAKAGTCLPAQVPPPSDAPKQNGRLPFPSKDCHFAQACCNVKGSCQTGRPFIARVYYFFFAVFFLPFLAVFFAVFFAFFAFFLAITFLL